VAGSADSFSIMLFVMNMLFVMLVLDCLVCVHGGLMEDHSSYQTCIANRPAAIVGHPTGCWRQLVDTWSAWGSNASSVGVSHALTLEECRFSWLGSQT
jgi:hypothetical protein